MTVAYLSYRLILTVVLVVIAVWSIYRPDDMNYYREEIVWLVAIWLVYISNWATLACTIYSALGAFVVMQRYLEVGKNLGELT